MCFFYIFDTVANVGVLGICAGTEVVKAETLAESGISMATGITRLWSRAALTSER